MTDVTTPSPEYLEFEEWMRREVGTGWFSLTPATLAFKVWKRSKAMPVLAHADTGLESGQLRVQMLIKGQWEHQPHIDQLLEGLVAAVIKHHGR